MKTTTTTKTVVVRPSKDFGRDNHSVFVFHGDTCYIEDWIDGECRAETDCTRDEGADALRDAILHGWHVERPRGR